MHIKEKKIYYCDFCKKHGLSSYHMERHEKHCTKNPDRYCNMCYHIDTSHDIEDLIKAFEDALSVTECTDRFGLTFHIENNHKALEALRDAADGCPACMLAAIRQSDKGEFLWFDFAKEKESFWSNVNDARQDAGYY